LERIGMRRRYTVITHILAVVVLFLLAVMGGYGILKSASEQQQRLEQTQERHR